MFQLLQRASAVSVITTVALTTPVHADETTIVSFSNGNIGAWTFGPPSPILTTGGNPTHHLRCTFVDTFAVQARTGRGNVSPFTGNYRERFVTAIGVDASLSRVDFSAGGRNMTLMLINDGGTPATFDDDCTVYFHSNQLIPQVGQGWRSYNFIVPAASTVIPPGWRVLDTGSSCSGTPSDVWNRIITDVDQVVFFWGDPELFFIFQTWNVGLDNPRITIDPPAPCPCDWNGIDGLDSQDFFDYLESFYLGDADFNGVDGTDSQDFFDFLDCFFTGCD